MNILLVEDDPDIRTIVRLALETVGGHTISTADNGAEALRQLETLRPDAILLDVMMPGMTGPQLLGALRRLPDLMDTPVVFLTAKAQPAEIAGYLAAGAQGVIAKPFDPMTLATQVQTLLSHAPSTAADRPVAPAPLPRRVMVIEDDAEIRYILQFLLEREGWEIKVAADGREASAMIDTEPPPALVLLDVMLPYADGFQLLAKIRALPDWLTVPVVMLTARTQETAIARALDHGANDYVVKPFQPVELMARLRRHLK